MLCYSYLQLSVTEKRHAKLTSLRFFNCTFEEQLNGTKHTKQVVTNHISLLMMSVLSEDFQILGAFFTTLKYLTWNGAINKRYI